MRAWELFPSRIRNNVTVEVGPKSRERKPDFPSRAAPSRYGARDSGSMKENKKEPHPGSFLRRPRRELCALRVPIEHQGDNMGLVTRINTYLRGPFQTS
jgi:hypothetical protein